MGFSRRVGTTMIREYVRTFDNFFWVLAGAAVSGILDAQ